MLRSVSKPFNGRLSLLGCEFVIVAFHAAKVASVIATFAEQKATRTVALAIGSQPIRESSVFCVFRGAKGEFGNKA
jgi:hypothetical protein